MLTVHVVAGTQLKFVENVTWAKQALCPHKRMNSLVVSPLIGLGKVDPLKSIPECLLRPANKRFKSPQPAVDLFEAHDSPVRALVADLACVIKCLPNGFVSEASHQFTSGLGSFGEAVAPVKVAREHPDSLRKGAPQINPEPKVGAIEQRASRWSRHCNFWLCYA